MILGFFEIKRGVRVSEMTSSMELVLTSIGIQNELATIVEMLALMREGFSSINIPCILLIYIVAHVIIANT